MVETIVERQICISFWGCSIGIDPTTDSMTLGSVTKVGVGAIFGRKNEKSVKSPIPACLDQHADLTWGWTVSCKIKLESPSTSPRGTADKPYQATTSPSDKPTGLEKCTESPQPDLQFVIAIPVLINFWE